MTAFTPKTYQTQVLESVEQYSRACHDRGTASTAFFETTNRLWGQGHT